MAPRTRRSTRTAPKSELKKIQAQAKADGPWTEILSSIHIKGRTPRGRSQDVTVIVVKPDITIDDFIKDPSILQLFQDEFQLQGLDLIAEHEKQTVYVKPKAKFYGSNLTERRVVESYMIQAFGAVINVPCTQCQQGKGIYYHCSTLNGFVNGACGNCKRGDRARECSLASHVVNRQFTVVDKSLDNEYFAGIRRTRLGRRRIRTGKESVEYDVENDEDVELASNLVELVPGREVMYKAQSGP